MKINTVTLIALTAALLATAVYSRQSQGRVSYHQNSTKKFDDMPADELITYYR